jgi:hypothetical protein
MRVLTLLVVLVVAVFVPAAGFAQAPAQAPPAPTIIHEQDGGTTEVLESIVIPPKANAPFTLTLQTEWVRNLYTGGAMTFVNQRRIARDSSGRYYQERWFLVPKNGKIESKMTKIQIADPVRHVVYSCELLNRRNICEETFYAETNNTVIRFDGPPPGPLPNDAGYASHADLGQQEIAGVATTGSRETINYNPGVFGNDAPMTVDREYWFSPQLGINLLSRLTDPRFGTQTFMVTEISPSEPDPQLFQLPAGYKVVDMRGKGGRVDSDAVESQ